MPKVPCHSHVNVIRILIAAFSPRVCSLDFYSNYRNFQFSHSVDVSCVISSMAYSRQLKRRRFQKIGVGTVLDIYHILLLSKLDTIQSMGQCRWVKCTYKYLAISEYSPPDYDSDVHLS